LQLPGTRGSLRASATPLEFVRGLNGRSTV